MFKFGFSVMSEGISLGKHDKLRRHLMIRMLVSHHFYSDSPLGAWFLGCRQCALRSKIIHVTEHR